MLERLLAKSLPPDCDKPPRGALLQAHTDEVLKAARVLLTTCADASLAAARIPAAERQRLDRLVLMAAFLHDLGKCSDHFQRAVRHRRPQLARHEALSAWLAWGEPLRSWLAAALGDDLPLAIAAAAGHHRKYHARAQLLGEHDAGTRLRCCCGHADFARTLALAPRELALGPPPVCVDRELRIMEAERGDLWPVLHDLNDTISMRLRADPVAQALLAVAKALVLAADVAGSAFPKVEQPTHADWITAALGSRAGGVALSGIAVKRLLRDQRPRPFQEQVAACDAPLVLVRAGCGTGKTVAAYLWAARHHGARQIWVAYPTTGTATEGFRDYLCDLPDLDTRLEHSRAPIDLELLGVGSNEDGDEGAREADRLESIRIWSDDVISCTCDTVLGLMQNQRKGLYAWPSLCRAAVVFDEIHAYDDRLFGCLLAFLRRLPGIPCLLMTASLPESRRAALDRLCREAHGRSLPVIDGPEDLEALPRYQRSHDDVAALIARTLSAGGKVLWVRNTVDRCLAAAEAVSTDWKPLVYHSRFRYVDRVQRHRAAIDAFHAPGPAIAIATQVAEMSLDLSADLLISDLAPIPALIQRLGRLNRRADPRNPPTPRPFIIEDFTGLPYAASDLAAAREWVDRLGDRPLCQRDLVDAWRSSAAVVSETPSAWWDGGYATEPAECRTGSPGISVLLERDATAVGRGPATARRFALPMLEPRHLPWRTWRQVAHLPVAPSSAITYDELRGARWLP